MKLAYSSNAYRRGSIEEAIARIARLGYDGLELMADVPHAWPAELTAARIDEIKKSLNSSGLALSNINAFMMSAVQDFWHPSWIEKDKGFRQLRVRHTIESLRLARRLGASCITTEPGGPLEAGMLRAYALEIFVEGLEEALRVAEEVEVMLLVEPEPGLLIENTTQFLELAQRIDSPMFGLNFDVGHFFCVNEDLPTAAGLADAIKKEFQVTPKLIEGSGGVFDVHVDDTQVWSKHDTGRFPEHKEVLTKIKGLAAKPK